MTKILLLLSIPFLSMGQDYTHQIELHGGMASTVFQNKFEKTYNANPNGVWKPSFGLDFNWVRDGESGLTFGLGLGYATYGLNFEGKYGELVAFITTKENASLSYFQVPVSLGYHWPKSKMDWCVSIGLTPSFLSSSKYTYTYAGFQGVPETYTITGKESYLNGSIYQSFQLLGSVKGGVKYHFHDDWGVRFNFQFQYGFLDIENTSTLLNNNTEFWTSGGHTTSSPEQAIYTKYDTNGQGTNIEYTTKTPTTKLSSLGFNLGLYYSF